MLREFFAEKFGHYPIQVDLVAVCNNPDSRRSVVGYTYLRNQAGRISEDSLKSAIENARESLKYCPKDCSITQCQLRNMAASTPRELANELYDSRPQIED
jgi:hypothetical protein